MATLTITTNNALLFTTYTNTLNNKTTDTFDLIFPVSTFFNAPPNNVFPVYTLVNMSYSNDVTGVIIPVSITGINMCFDTASSVGLERNISLPPGHISNPVCEVDNKLSTVVYVKKGNKLATVKLNEPVLIRVDKMFN